MGSLLLPIIANVFVEEWKYRVDKTGQCFHHLDIWNRKIGEIFGQIKFTMNTELNTFS